MKSFQTCLNVFTLLFYDLFLYEQECKQRNLTVREKDTKDYYNEKNNRSRRIKTELSKYG
jgi:hypothetical protein